MVLNSLLLGSAVVDILPMQYKGLWNSYFHRYNKCETISVVKVRWLLMGYPMEVYWPLSSPCSALRKGVHLWHCYWWQH